MSANFDLKKYRNPYFIETGTYINETTQRALSAGYDKVISIDIQKKFIDRAKRELKEFVEKEKLYLYHGDSTEVLEEILPDIDKKITFWLDAHTDGSGDLYPEDTEESMRCRLYEELDVIATHSINTHTIMIDDVRKVRNESWGRNDINFDGIKKRLLNINKSYNFIFENGHVENDVLIAYI